jgi:hypothetical protein
MWVSFFATAVGMTQDPCWRGVGFRTQPAGDVHGQHEPSVRRFRQGHGGQVAAQPGDLDLPVGQGAVQAAVSAPMFGRQRCFD